MDNLIPAPAPHFTRRRPSRDARPKAQPLDQDPARTDLARAVLGYGLMLGIAADALLRDGPGGLGFLLWIALVALSAVALSWRADRRIPREAEAWLLSALAFSAAMSWRDDQPLQFLNVVATICSLGMAAAVIAGTPISGIFGARVRDLALATPRHRRRHGWHRAARRQRSRPPSAGTTGPLGRRSRSAPRRGDHSAYRHRIGASAGERRSDLRQAADQPAQHRRCIACVAWVHDRDLHVDRGGLGTTPGPRRARRTPRGRHCSNSRQASP